MSLNLGLLEIRDLFVTQGITSLAFQPFIVSHLLFAHGDIYKMNNPSRYGAIGGEPSSLVACMRHVATERSPFGLFSGFWFHPLIHVCRLLVYRGLSILASPIIKSKPIKGLVVGVATVTLTYPLQYFYIRASTSYFRSFSLAEDVNSMIKEGKLGRVFSGLELFIMAQIVQKGLSRLLPKIICLSNVIKNKQICEIVTTGAIASAGMVIVYPLYTLMNEVILNSLGFSEITTNAALNRFTLKKNYRGFGYIAIATFALAALKTGLKIYLEKK